jgi:hypothetical protein
MFQARHGDVYLVQVAKLPKGSKAQKREGDIILAYGEVTGHAHRIKDPTARLWLDGTNTYLTLKEVSQLTHEEHGPIALQPGVYQVLHQREYSPEEIRRVQD